MYNRCPAVRGPNCSGTELTVSCRTTRCTTSVHRSTTAKVRLYPMSSSLGVWPFLANRSIVNGVPTVYGRWPAGVYGG